MGIVGNLDQYTQFQSAQAIEAAANNQGGAGEGLGIGLGMALGQRAAGAGQQQQYQQQPQTAPQAAQPQGPPPLPQAEQWFLGANGRQLGPFDRNQLAQQVSGGALKHDTLVWKAGMAQWTPAGQVPEVAPLLAATPPPLPPA